MNKTLNVLNLYAGIGGNSKLWDWNINVTAVEIDKNIASVYKDLNPDHTVIVADAHKYLEKHFREFDFIWASPPCPTHSVLQMTRYHSDKLKYPDMTLYQEIIWLKTFFKGKWVVENVKPYYTPLIPPTFSIGRHYFWSSDFILSPEISDNYDSIRNNINLMAETYGFDIKKIKRKGIDTRKVLRNCVKPEIGKYIFDALIEREVKNG